jgi:carboxymethylenebutenolidase
MSTLQLRASDGNVFSAYLAKPEGRPKGAIVVIQEIFGVTSHIRRVAEQYASKGYIAVAPALFDRLEKGVELPYDATGLEQGMNYVGQLDDASLLADLNATIDSVTHAGRVGMVGFCWGGRVTYLAACHTNIAAAVAYYGGGIVNLLENVPRCPTMFHFGEKDIYISAADVKKIREAYPQGVYHLYPVGHGFNCTDRADFDSASAHLAFDRSTAFFDEFVG